MILVPLIHSKILMPKTTAKITLTAIRRTNFTGFNSMNNIIEQTEKILSKMMKYNTNRKHLHFVSNKTASLYLLKA